jgi:hypothetical protein
LQSGSSIPSAVIGFHRPSGVVKARRTSFPLQSPLRPLPAHPLERISAAARPRLQQPCNNLPTLVAEPHGDRQPQLAARTQQETTMNPTTACELGRARLADWHLQAERDRIARAARSARKNHASHLSPGHLTTILARRVHAALGIPSWRPPAQPGQAPKATP